MDKRSGTLANNADLFLKLATHSELLLIPFPFKMQLTQCRDISNYVTDQ